MTSSIRPWEIWWTDFDPHLGREQAGRRHAIVVGSVLACQLPNRLAIVVPCTTRDRGLPFHPPVSCLDQPTFALCDQVKSISRERLVRRHGAVIATAEIDAIRFVLRQMVDIA